MYKSIGLCIFIINELKHNRKIMIYNKDDLCLEIILNELMWYFRNYDKYHRVRIIEVKDV